MSPDINVREKQPLSTGAAETTTDRPMFVPQVDIWESDEGLTIVADMPGVCAEGLSIDLRDNTLTINGKVVHEEDKTKYLQKEYEVGDFHRQFALSESIDQDNIAATLTNGVLTLKLPKIAPAQPRKIEVKVEG